MTDDMSQQQIQTEDRIPATGDRKTSNDKGQDNNDETSVSGSRSPASGQPGEDRLVPVGESIKYRKRAQQAEGRLTEIERELTDLRERVKTRDDELATAEAQRDEARHHVQVVENRSAAERMLMASGVVDVETAGLLLSKRVDLTEDVDEQTIARAVEQLLLDKPFLLPEPVGGLPPSTSAAKDPRAAAQLQVASAARQASATGDRRDVAEYLRQRRRAANS